MNRFESGLGRTPANHVALTPVSFLGWAGRAYPDRLAIVCGERRFTWRETEARCRRLASALASHGVGCGDTVSVMLANTAEMVEAHFAVPMTGAVLHTIHARLDAESIGFQLEHGSARVLIADTEFADTLARATPGLRQPPLAIAVGGAASLGAGDGTPLEYERVLDMGDPAWEGRPPADEGQAIALNYTSGTTGDPKGVVYDHRGAYLNAISNALGWSMPRHPVFLWTLPMFHCNGWCFPWTITALAGTHVCLRRMEPQAALDLARRHRVTHYAGAPIVHAMLAESPPSAWRDLPRPIHGLLGGAPPSPELIARLEGMGIELTHSYGLTETFGPAAICVPQASWANLDSAGRAARKARQGIRTPLLEAMEVRDPSTLEPAPWDGETAGEVMFRGNGVMRGYLDNPRATDEAFRDGWLRSGDLAVTHPDGYVQITGRSKDVIISGGENIASLEVEQALDRHPAVLASAVVAMPHPRWGETPCAFVELRPGADVSEAALIAHCAATLARFKVPSAIVFSTLPRTATGKVRKHLLRDRARARAAEAPRG